MLPDNMYREILGSSLQLKPVSRRFQGIKGKIQLFPYFLVQNPFTFHTVSVNLQILTWTFPVISQPLKKALVIPSHQKEGSTDL